MRIRVKTHGVEEMIASLRNTADRVSSTARKTMHRGADKIVEEARLNAPVDKHNLEESIRKEVAYGYRGRLEIDIAMGGIVNGVNVDEYALEIHENYEARNPGKGTIAKRNANPGRYVGGKFLERAVETVRKTLSKDMIRAVMREFRL